MMTPTNRTIGNSNIFTQLLHIPYKQQKKNKNTYMKKIIVVLTCIRLS